MDYLEKIPSVIISQLVAISTASSATNTHNIRNNKRIIRFVVLYILYTASCFWNVKPSWPFHVIKEFLSKCNKIIKMIKFYIHSIVRENKYLNLTCLTLCPELLQCCWDHKMNAREFVACSIHWMLDDMASSMTSLVQLEIKK